MTRIGTACVVFACVAGILGTGKLANGQSKSWIDGDAATILPVDHLHACDSGCDAMPGCCDVACRSGSGCDSSVGCGWTVHANGLFLDRSDPDSLGLAVNTDSPDETLNADDFDFDVESGLELTLGRAFGQRYAIELRYFDIDGWQSNILTSTTPGELLQINAAVPVFTFTGNAIQSGYRSQLQNAEINLRRSCGEYFTLLAGFRYAELDERLSASAVNAATPLQYQCSTENRMYGAQFGAEALLWTNDNFTLDAFGKAGIFGNDASQSSTIRTGLVTSPAVGGDDSTSFLGELGVSGAVHFSEHWSFRGGYRLLWLTGQALASEQLPTSNFAAGTGFTDDGDLFYHGATAGIEYLH